jgi:hypothetical protein
MNMFLFIFLRYCKILFLQAILAPRAVLPTLKNGVFTGHREIFLIKEHHNADPRTNLARG